MKKHFKLISTLICLMLCFALISFGVYSIATSYKELNSSVSFTPTTARLKIFGGIYGDVGFDSVNQPESSRYYACNQNTTSELGNYSESDGKYYFGSWQYGDLTFVDHDDGSESSIYFYIQITNYGETLIDYAVEFGSSFSSDVVGYNVYYYRANNYSNNLETNTKLTTYASVNGYWDISSQQSAIPNFTKLEESAMNEISVLFDDSTSKPTKATIPNIDSMFSTTMIVVKLKVLNVENNIEKSTFEFGINAQTVQE